MGVDAGVGGRTPTQVVSAGTRPDVGERSLAELLSQTTQDLSGLLRSEVELAKVELKQEATTAAKAGGMLGAAGVLGHLALLLALFAAAWGLAAVMPTGWAFLIVAVVVALVAFVLYRMGRARLEEATPVAPNTTQTLKEDVEWARQLRS
jgi:uncharacterized membrane protein YqjE